MRVRLAAVAVSMLMVSACGSKSSSVDVSGVTPIAAKTLTACSDIPYEPFEFNDGANVKGIDVDLVNAVADDFGWKASFKTVAFDGIFAAMNNQQCDMVASAVSITDERKKQMLFSNGYFEINQAMLVRSADAADLSSLDKLKGHNVGVQSATTGEQYLNAHNSGFTVVPLTGQDELITALHNKTVDAVVQDYPVASYQAKKSGDLVVTQTFTDVQREEYGFAFPTASVKLRDAVNASLAKIRDDGRYDQILQSYLGASSN